MNLEDIRKEIDQVDNELVKNFLKRMDISKKVAKEKEKTGSPVVNTAREREILSRVSDMAGEDMEVYARVLYNTLFDVSKAYQTRILSKENETTRRIKSAAENTPKLFPQRGRVACQGVEGAYSQIACDKLFSAPDIMYFKNFEGVFRAVETGLCEYGVLPIENSSYGSVSKVYDLMKDYNFSIIRSIKIHIDHNLLAKAGTKISDIKEILSHDQALGQCSAYLEGLGPDVKITVCANTAEAARLVSQTKRGDIAAISSHNCAQLYNLCVLKEGIQNSQNNYTRFICITKDLLIFPGSNKTSLMFSVAHKPGALYAMISRFAALGINLTKLESRPIPGRDFEFMFYFDLDASVWSEDVIKLIGQLSQSGSGETFVFLGCYSEM